MQCKLVIYFQSCMRCCLYLCLFKLLAYPSRTGKAPKNNLP
nr:MAG TPA: hypothetical protein [Caudoviricetes sp.]